MTWRVEDASLIQSEDIATILHGWNLSTHWMPKLHNFQETVDFARLMIGKGWVRVVQDEQVCGFIARDGAMIHSLYVEGGARGRGVGSALISDAQYARDDLTLWVFEKNLQAQAFYHRHGFVEAERSDGSGNDEKLPDIRYVWQARVQDD